MQSMRIACQPSCRESHQGEHCLLDAHHCLRPITPYHAVKGQKVLGSPFWGRYSRGLVDWLVINAVLYLALVAQARRWRGWDVCDCQKCGWS